MNRHLPHLLGLAKGFLLAAGLAGFLASGTAGAWSETLGRRFPEWTFLQIPFYWMMVIMGSLLLVFPITLLEDHLLRRAEGTPEETPFQHWLHGFSMELLVGTLLGSLVYAAMHFLPGSWWLILSAAWAGYHVAQPWIQSMSLKSSQEDDASDTSHPELLAEVQPSLNAAGASISDVRVMTDEPDLPWMHPDIHFLKSGQECIMFVPASWAHDWTTPEITAVALHKVWMERRIIRLLELLIHVATAVFCLGGFAVLFRLLSDRFNVGAIHDLRTVPVFLLWAVLSVSLARMAAYALSRRWMFMADASVIRWMHTEDGLVAALERARTEMPAYPEPPRWAEVLFFNAPSLQQRIQRLKIR